MTYKFAKPARPVSRVFLHCSASDRPEHDSAAVIDAWHKQRGWAGIGYHFFIRKDGALEPGRDLEKTPAAQAGNNTGTIAICLHGLELDKFTDAQFQTLRQLCDQINQAYGGTVSFHGHCEVSDKTCPVFDYVGVLGLGKGGHRPLVQSVPVAIATPAVDFGDLEVLKPYAIVLKRGVKSQLVKDLQQVLARLGYFPGAFDGDFGSRTDEALRAFQADHHLEADGKLGALTREALADAKPRAVAAPRAAMGLLDLSAAGSRIAQSSIRNIAVGAILGGGGLATVIDDITGQAGVIQKVFAEHGLVTGGVILAAGLFVAWQSWRAGQARVEDHRTGKTA